jgi:hypothetical protein
MQLSKREKATHDKCRYLQVHYTWILWRIALSVHPAGLGAFVGGMKRVKVKVIHRWLNGFGPSIRLHGQFYNSVHLYLQAHLHPRPLGLGLLLLRQTCSLVCPDGSWIEDATRDFSRKTSALTFPLSVDHAMCFDFRTTQSIKRLPLAAPRCYFTGRTLSVMTRL